MPLIGAAATAAALAALTLTPSAPADSQPTARVTQGRLQGLRNGGVDEFLGIPYAAPPVGRLRWRPPHPAQAWYGTRQATAFGSQCPQIAGPSTVSVNEDCLFLNVYTPAARSARPMPVMVWIHGGGNIYGSGATYPQAMAARGVVVVTINYRLGAFGSLALPSLSAEAHDHASGEYGLMDQQAALRWVKHNAGAFGGDRRNVTIFGESAGAASVCQQMASPTARGLFQRAIMESGCSWVLPSQAQANITGTALATELGCTNAVTAARCMRTKPAAEIVLTAGTSLTQWLPAFGGSVEPRRVREAFLSGAYHHVPVINGSNHDEGDLFIPENHEEHLTRRQYPGAIVWHFGPEAAARIARQYPLSHYASPAYALSAALTDSIFACPAYEDDGILSAQNPTYAYEFNDPEPVGLEDVRAAHGAEINYLFPYPGLNFTPAQRALSNRMIDYWTRFAAAGNPDGRHAPTWPPFTTHAPLVQELRPTGIAPSTTFAARHKCAFWLPLLASGTVTAVSDPINRRLSPPAPPLPTT